MRWTAVRDEQNNWRSYESNQLYGPGPSLIVRLQFTKEAEEWPNKRDRDEGSDPDGLK